MASTGLPRDPAEGRSHGRAIGGLPPLPGSLRLMGGWWCSAPCCALMRASLGDMLFIHVLSGHSLVPTRAGIGSKSSITLCVD